MVNVKILDFRIKYSTVEIKITIIISTGFSFSWGWPKTYVNLPPYRLGQTLTNPES
jgi:hypothetical protein